LDIKVQPNYSIATAFTKGNYVLHYILMWLFLFIFLGKFFKAYKFEQTYLSF